MSALLASLVPVTVGNVEMLVPGENDRLYDVYRSGCWYEGDLLAAIKGRQQGGVFVDVGANHGNHTIFFAVECMADRVVAIEPYPGEWEILTANIKHCRLEGIVEPVRALVHPEWESVSLSPSRGDVLPPTWCYSQQPVLTPGGDTPCVTLDNLLEPVDVDVLKVDVEEMGPDVLATGCEVLARCRPLVAIEAEPAEEQAIEEILKPLGYRCLGVFCATPTFLWSARHGS